MTTEKPTVSLSIGNSLANYLQDQFEASVKNILVGMLLGTPYWAH